MPYATLLKPASLRIGNLSFEQGVRKPVTRALAEALEINPRFRVEMRDEEESGAADVADLKMKAKTVAQPKEEVPEEEPTGTDLDEVAEAIGLLDADDEDAFLDNGMPNPEAVAKLVGQPVNATDIARAMATELKKEDRRATATAAEIAATQDALAGRGRKLRVPSRRPATATVEDDDTAGAVEA